MVPAPGIIHDEATLCSRNRGYEQSVLIDLERGWFSVQREVADDLVARTLADAVGALSSPPGSSLFLGIGTQQLPVPGHASTPQKYSGQRG